jgi:hypothetical protein
MMMLAARSLSSQLIACFRRLVIVSSLHYCSRFPQLAETHPSKRAIVFNCNTNTSAGPAGYFGV